MLPVTLLCLNCHTLLTNFSLWAGCTCGEERHRLSMCGSVPNVVVGSVPNGSFGSDKYLLSPKLLLLPMQKFGSVPNGPFGPDKYLLTIKLLLSTMQIPGSVPNLVPVAGNYAAGRLLTILNLFLVFRQDVQAGEEPHRTPTTLGMIYYATLKTIWPCQLQLNCHPWESGMI
jgi:hypothetical protein